MMHSILILAQSALSVSNRGLWGFVALVLLILFVTLVVSDGSQHRDK